MHIELDGKSMWRNLISFAIAIYGNRDWSAGDRCWTGGGRAVVTGADRAHMQMSPLYQRDVSIRANRVTAKAGLRVLPHRALHRSTGERKRRREARGSTYHARSANQGNVCCGEDELRLGRPVLPM
jgi:hypothetical protein